MMVRKDFITIAIGLKETKLTLEEAIDLRDTLDDAIKHSQSPSLNDSIKEVTTIFSVGKKLEDVLPFEFKRDFTNTRAYKMKDAKVVSIHKTYLPGDGERWIGSEKYVFNWFKLDNGYAVAFNENPNRGWSFPVIKL